ncbi:hypothetical protein AYO44_06360 [Planctomycetaceae bacterium SCGC AG-212-F19]|nr:hypothetical protein AYO44_06360 [Planctomycetaceae bacterium SCGC AG-212-F19]
MDNPEADLGPSEPLLEATPAPAPAALREAVLRHTTGVLRRRARRRRLTIAAGLAACYAAGLATMYVAGLLWHRSADRPAPTPEPIVAGPADERPASSSPILSAARLEREGETAGSAERAALFRLAGTRYLQETGDVRAALRCYANALDEDPDTTPSSQDHWLLMALKDARQKEKADAKNPN